MKTPRVAPPVLDSASYRVRVGCDLVELSEIENSVSSFGPRYLHRIYTDTELENCAGPNGIPRLAARFAAKEAVVKAFALPEAAFAFHEIEVILVDSAPTIRLTGITQGLAAEQGWGETSLSLSHTGCHAMALVVVVCSEQGASGDHRPEPLPHARNNVHHNDFGRSV